MNFQTVPEISPLEFAGVLEAGETVHVVDVRPPERVAAGHIDAVPRERFQRESEALESGRNECALGGN
jgi:rhodanese-related sulfurtransferase